MYPSLPLLSPTLQLTFSSIQTWRIQVGDVICEDFPGIDRTMHKRVSGLLYKKKHLPTLIILR